MMEVELDFEIGEKVMICNGNVQAFVLAYYIMEGWQVKYDCRYWKDEKPFNQYLYSWEITSLKDKDKKKIGFKKNGEANG